MSKFVMSNRNVIIPSPDGSDSIRLFRGQVGEAPDWAVRTAYFRALVEDGKLIVSNGKKGRPKEEGGKNAGEKETEEQTAQ